MAKKKKRSEPQVIGLLGVGLDQADGHKRLTKSEHFLLIGGSEETHGRMQETFIRFDEELKERGKRLQDAEVDEVIEILHKATE